MSRPNPIIPPVVFGGALRAINAHVPMDGKMMPVLNIMVVIAVVLWLPRPFGLAGDPGRIRVGG